MWNDWLPLGYGVIVGLSLGLTGSGGSIFAVPLLIYGLGVGVRDSVGISLAAVGGTALLGAIIRLRTRELDLPVSLVFALVGMAAAPIGTTVGVGIPESITLVLFAFLMIFAGYKLWVKKGQASSGGTTLNDSQNDGALSRWQSKNVGILITAGFVAGLLSGIFGVGGGFIIVPSLILATGMPINKAIASSLLVITMICISGVVSYFIRGDQLPIGLTASFILGGFLGIVLGTSCAKAMPPKILQRFFATGMWGVALFVLVKNTFL